MGLGQREVHTFTGTAPTERHVRLDLTDMLLQVHRRHLRVLVVRIVFLLLERHVDQRERYLHTSIAEVDPVVETALSAVIVGTPRRARLGQPERADSVICDGQGVDRVVRTTTPLLHDQGSHPNSDSTLIESTSVREPRWSSPTRCNNAAPRPSAVHMRRHGIDIGADYAELRFVL